jgi:hypothetical protein
VCDYAAQQRVSAAIDAGAAAVLFHGATGRAILPYWTAQHLPRDRSYAPVLSLPVDEGLALAAALATRQVTVTATGEDNSPYLYYLKFYHRNQIPTRPDLTVDRRNLVETDNRYHRDTPEPLQYHAWSATNTGSDFSAFLLQQFSTGVSTRTEYLGPVADDVTFLQNRQLVRFDETGGHWGMPERVGRVYAEPGRYTYRWGQQPFTVGGSASLLDQRQPGGASCDDCRVGELLQASHSLRNGAGMRGPFTMGMDYETGQPTNETLRLFQGEREVPFQLLCGSLIFFCILFPTFTMPADPGTYRMTSQYHNPYEFQRYARDIDTEWTFRYQRPGDGDPRVFCWLGDIFGKGTCHPASKLYLNYDVPLALDNTAKAGRPQVVSFSGYTESAGDPRVRLTSLTLEVSYDSGTTWKRVPATQIKGEYQAVLLHPSLGKSDGTVSLRVNATSADGNTIKQTIKRAYGLR